MNSWSSCSAYFSLSALIEYYLIDEQAESSEQLEQLLHILLTVSCDGILPD